GLLDQSAYRQVRTAVNVAGDALDNPTAPSFLAMPYPATQVTTPPGIWLTDNELMVFSQYHGVSVQSYQATSVDVAPTSAQLRGVSKPTGLQADLALPASYQTKALKQIAEEHTAGQSTEYDKVNALAAWLSGPAFAYSAAGAPVNSAASLYSFLSKTHLGVCVQSAWAMTVLTRLLGIPARLAGGFTEGTHAAGKTYVVKTDDAHVWAQVYFSGFGWINFEATPPGGDGSAQASSYQTGTGPNSEIPPPIPGSIEGSDAPTKAVPTAGGQANKFIGAGGGSSAQLSGKSAGTPWAAITLAILAAIALACGVIAIVAPPAHRVVSAHVPDGARRRRPVSLTNVAL
ncbi:MAG: transglutaminase-like domain-containing protein, partial [Streptosporangiaceae bacterium]